MDKKMNIENEINQKISLLSWFMSEKLGMMGLLQNKKKSQTYGVFDKGESLNGSNHDIE